MENKKTIIAFAAHQDDLELRAGGTVAKYVKMGYEVIYVVMVDSVYVSTEYENYEKLSHEEILQLRCDESRAGAKTLGTKEPIFFHLKPTYYWTAEKNSNWRVHFNDGEEELIKNMCKHKGKYFSLQAARSPECVQELVDFIAQHKPEIVLTQQANDLHPEHYAVASLVFTACRELAQQGAKLKLYSWEVGSNGNMSKFVPDVIVDITEEFDTKIASLKHFVSQFADKPETFTEYARQSAEFWGSKIGVKYAEPFTELPIALPLGGFSKKSEIFEYSINLPNPELISKEL